MSDEGLLSLAVLTQLVEATQAEAIVLLQEGGWWSVPVAMQLAQWALERADVDVTQANAALALAALVATEMEEPPVLLGQIAYGQARCAVHQGDLAAAEAALLRAQVSWQSAGASALFARAFLGLTQVYAMQGCYAEAGAAAQGAIDALQPLVSDDPGIHLLLARAYRNFANLLGYQEQHGAARDAYWQAMAELQRFQAILPAEEQGELDGEFGHLALNLASAHTFLDEHGEAERLLLEAIARFDRAQEGVNRGRGRTNLGRLYLRLGEYGRALNVFESAAADLMDGAALGAMDDPDADVDALRQADELLLEQALAYLTLNLLPEAASALARCVRLFRRTGQPYELAQSRYSQGMLWLQQGSLAESQAALDEALALYQQLGNHFWHNRTQTARARLAYAQGDVGRAAALLDELLASPDVVTGDGAVAWDRVGLVDVWLRRTQLWLDGDDVDAAEGAILNAEELLGRPTLIDVESGVVPLPHLVLRLLHGRGRIAAARGMDIQARAYFAAAVELLDRHRSTLPLEEVRTAYLDDKMVIYSDLVVSLLAAPLPSEDEVAAAFAVVERARSRALLERLLTTVDDLGDDGAGQEESAGQENVNLQRAALRRQLHWLYNQLLGESGNRHLDGQLGREVAQHEAAIRRLEWQNAPLLAQAEAVRLDELQAILSPDQQAITYYFAGDEVLAFVVSRADVHVVRRLTTVTDLMQAQADLRFQLGRVELGPAYVARHQARLLRGVQGALGTLFQLLVAPLQPLITASRLLLIPYGLLHLLPFHALWDGKGYWLEQVEIAYVPSASIAVHKKQSARLEPYHSFGGFAPYDERIPQAQVEIAAASAYFTVVKNYPNDEATLLNLSHAAASVDVLHLATHGLFRPDNPFFSAIKFADGWMDVREIYRLHLLARLVVLSACESGVGEVRAGDEVVGLARGFLAAGAEYLLASLWNVHDASAADLMATFYRILQAQEFADHGALNDDLRGEVRHGQAQIRPASALRAAQLMAAQAGEHPYYWASFFAIG